MPEYQAVPVEAARDIGRRFDKQIVVVIAWDQTCGQIHTTTWGLAASHKEWAAELGPKLAAVAGGKVELAKYFEDFRSPSTAAENAAKLELLRSKLHPNFMADFEYPPGTGHDVKQHVSVIVDSLIEVLREVIG